MLAGPFPGRSVVKVGTKSLRVFRKVLTEVPDASPEGSISTPPNLQRSLAVAPVLHESLGANWVRHVADGDEVATVLAIKVSSLTPS